MVVLIMVEGVVRRRWDEDQTSRVLGGRQSCEREENSYSIETKESMRNVKQKETGIQTHLPLTIFALPLDH